MILSQSNFYIVIPLFAIVLGDGVHTAAEVFWKVDGRKISLERHSPSACTSLVPPPSSRFVVLWINWVLVRSP